MCQWAWGSGHDLSDMSCRELYARCASYRSCVQLKVLEVGMAEIHPHLLPQPGLVSIYHVSSTSLHCLHDMSPLKHDKRVVTKGIVALPTRVLVVSSAQFPVFLICASA